MVENSQNNPQDLAAQAIDGPDMLEDNSAAPTVQPTAITEVPTLLSPQTQTMAQPFPELPIRDFLSKNFRKPDLHKRCHELGLTNLWTSSKSQLIEMIIEKSRPPSNDTVRDDMPTPPSPSQSPPIPHDVTQTLPSNTTQQDNLDLDKVDMLDIVRKIETIMSKLETKDSEIDLLNTEIKTAYHTIEQLQNCIAELEQHHCGSEAHHHASGTRSAPTNNYLLLGDMNLQTILCSDLQNNCQIKTIFEANMDLLRCWINEKLIFHLSVYYTTAPQIYLKKSHQQQY